MTLSKKQLLEEAHTFALHFLEENYRITGFFKIGAGFIYVLTHSNGNRIVVKAFHQHVLIYKNNKLLKDVQIAPF